MYASKGNLLISLSLHFFLVEILFYGAGETSPAGDVLPGIAGTFPGDNGKAERPFFDTTGPRNVTAVVGQTAALKCRVKLLGERTVSWIRKRDLHVLTSSVITFTGDARFAVVHPENSDDWKLEIRYVQKRDAGVYECQVNTEPKMNLAMYLHVEDRDMLSEQGISSTKSTSEAQAKIWGQDEQYVKTGSMISLTCSVNIHSQPAASIAWYHGSTLVDFNSPRGGISLETEKTDTGTTSKLVISKAQPTDNGNYSCVPSNAQQTSVWVHVLVNGEFPAAMQHGEHSNASCGTSSSLHLLAVTLIIFMFVNCLINEQTR